MSSALIIAWYGCLLLAGQWGLIGPYESREACMSVVEWLETQGFDTETCTVVMGWIPSKFMDGLDRNNQLMGTLASGADSQRELASTVKEMSSTIKAQSVTIAELRVLLTKQTEWNQDQCRLLAKALRSADANEKCGHINR